MLSICGRRIPKTKNISSSTSSSSKSLTKITNKDFSSSSSPQQLLLSSIFLNHEFPSNENLQQQKQKLMELYSKDKKEFFATALPKNWLMFSTLIVDRFFPLTSSSSSKFDFTKQLFLSKFTNPDTFH